MNEKELLEQLNSNWKALQAKLEQRDDEIKRYGEETTELKAQIAVLAEKQAQYETAQNRPQMFADAKAKADTEVEQRKEAFERWARKGRESLTPDELKLLSNSDDVNGGFLAPREFVADVIKGAVEFSPLRSIVSVRTTSAKGIEIPKRTGVLTASWAGEGTDTTATNPQYGIETIDAHQLVSVSDVTLSELEDTAFNLPMYLNEDMAEQFGVAEGAAMISGNGIKKPEGILTHSGVAYTAGGDASALKADGIIALTFAVKTAYAQNGTFVLNRNTLAAIYQLKDSQNQYLYRPNQEIGKAPTIQGRPYVECPDMPDVAANAYPIVYGDFRRAYMLVDRASVSVLRDDYSQSSKATVRFVGRKRIGGQVVLAEAIRKLKIATA